MPLAQEEVPPPPCPALYKIYVEGEVRDTVTHNALLPTLPHSPGACSFFSGNERCYMCSHQFTMDSLNMNVERTFYMLAGPEDQLCLPGEYDHLCLQFGTQECDISRMLGHQQSMSWKELLPTPCLRQALRAAYSTKMSLKSGGCVWVLVCCVTDNQFARPIVHHQRFHVSKIVLQMYPPFLKNSGLYQIGSLNSWGHQKLY